MSTTRRSVRNKAQQDIRRKKRVLEHAARIGNVRKTCRYFGVAWSGFYVWKKAYETHGDQGLINQRPCPKNPRLCTPPAIVEKVLHLHRTYHLGPICIVWYLERYHGITISHAGVYRILRRHGLNRLPARVGRRAVHTHRYAKQVPGHHVQVDVTFLKLVSPDGTATRRYQYTAIDDATRIRALTVYARHTQKNAIRFLDHVIEKFPFRIHTVRTDRGHEFQAQFHWHLADQGIRHVYIKARTPQLNGKVERSHRTDKQEFYQLLTYKGDVDLQAKLAEWENFYNYQRPHGAFQGKTPYEALREKLG
ncbi:MAG TPA: IS481 family transposase [Dehalococcoidia bacterium]|nr:IS481 family transposase [Dehalococcoidia bacterium]